MGAESIGECHWYFPIISESANKKVLVVVVTRSAIWIVKIGASTESILAMIAVRFPKLLGWAPTAVE